MNKFKFNGKSYKYLKHKYNQTWTNERTVEIPVTLDQIKGYKNILEVGNVLNHYKKFKHDVVDLYEKEKGVINEDIREFKTNKKYDLIVSVSTIEHIGDGEEGFLKAFQNMKSLLTPTGEVFITLPIGQNTCLDNLLKTKRLGLKEAYYMKKDSQDDYKFENNIWEQCSFSDIHSFEPCMYGYDILYKGFWPVGIKVIYVVFGKL